MFWDFDFLERMGNYIDLKLPNRDHPQNGVYSFSRKHEPFKEVPELARSDVEKGIYRKKPVMI